MLRDGGDETHVHDRDGLLAGGTKIFDHVLDEHRTLGDDAVYNVC